MKLIRQASRVKLVLFMNTKKTSENIFKDNGQNLNKFILKEGVTLIKNEQ